MSVELHRLAGPVKDALPTELSRHGVLHVSWMFYFPAPPGTRRPAIHRPPGVGARKFRRREVDAARSAHPGRARQRPGARQAQHVPAPARNPVGWVILLTKTGLTKKLVSLSTACQFLTAPIVVVHRRMSGLLGPLNFLLFLLLDFYSALVEERLARKA